MLIKTVQITGAAAYDSQVVIHNSNENTKISLARGVQKNVSDPTRSHGLLDHSKDIKRARKLKCTERENRVQHRNYGPHTSLEMSCATTQFLAFPFCVPHSKSHRVIYLSKHFHL